MGNNFVPSDLVILMGFNNLTYCLNMLHVLHVTKKLELSFSNTCTMILKQLAHMRL